MASDELGRAAPSITVDWHLWLQTKQNSRGPAGRCCLAKREQLAKALELSTEDLRLHIVQMEQSH